MLRDHDVDNVKNIETNTPRWHCIVITKCRRVSITTCYTSVYHYAYTRKTIHKYTHEKRRRIKNFSRDNVPITIYLPTINIIKKKKMSSVTIGSQII